MTSSADSLSQRKATFRLRVLRHFEEVTHNVSATCRHFGIHRSQFYDWRKRFEQFGEHGLRDARRGSKVSPWRTPPHIEALILDIRTEKRYGAQRLSYFLQRYHEIYVSAPTIRRILREHQVPAVHLKRHPAGTSQASRDQYPW
ncbi:MAG: helix-turn-helix domain containing protein [Burkholderiales bacterium]|nr:helix-turn-helix domain containing protein [Burkholderiales bacterium]